MTLALGALVLSLAAVPTHAQSGARDLREIHQRAVYATVRIATATGTGSGWLLAQSGRPFIVTNRHVATMVGRNSAAQAYFYRGAAESEVGVPIVRFHLAQQADIGILRLLEDPPSTARPVRMRTDTSVTRGERVVLAGNPVDRIQTVLPFQTTEGVVTGHIAGTDYAQCGQGRNCVVVDAASFRGSSGGPAFNVTGQLVGMLWGGPIQRSSAGAVQNPTFSYLIHTRTIAAELSRLQRR